MALVILCVVMGGIAGVATATHAAPAAAPAPRGASAVPLAPAVTNGDLNVTGTAPYIIGPSQGHGTYYQGGNITVQPGATLIVRNTTLSFVQYIGSQGSIPERLSHIYRFVDLGTVEFYNSTLTTFTQVLNLSAKLFVSVTGTWTAWNSSFEFPGWFNVAGAGAVATFNDSAIEANPAIPLLPEPATLVGDTEYAPVLNVSAEGELNLFGSSYTQLYADNWTTNGQPTIQPLDYAPVGGIAIPVAGVNVSGVALTSQLVANSTQLAEDMLYPAQASSLVLAVDYTSSSGTAQTSTIYAWYDGARYEVGVATFAAGTSAQLTFPLGEGSALVQAMARTGVPFYALDDLQFAAPSGTGVTLNSIDATMTPAPNFNITAYDPGATINVVGSTLGLNWTPTIAQTTIAPWESNKMVVTDSARAYLAAMSVPSVIPQVSSTSAVLTTDNGAAAFYRWAQFNLTGKGGYLPIDGAQVVAFPGLNASQGANATATELNALATTVPAIWHYVEYLDASAGAPGYGESGRSGIASLLLAAGYLVEPTLPNGNYTGSYHVGITIPTPTPATSWFNWTVTPYPAGVANGTVGYGTADFAPPQTFPSYFASIGVATSAVTSNGTALVNNTVDDYRVLGINLTITATGTADIFNLTGNLSYGGSPPIGIASFPFTNVTLAPGASTSILFTWLVNTSVTGLQGSVNHAFDATIVYNGGSAKYGGGNVSHTTLVSISPYVAHLAPTFVLTGNGTLLPNNDTVRIGQRLGVNVTLAFSGAATVTSIYAAVYYGNTNATTKPLGTYNATHLALDTPGATVAFQVDWVVNDTTVGLQTKTIATNLYLTLVWNNAQTAVGGNTSRTAEPMNVAPSQVRFVSFNPPPTTLSLSGSYESSGFVQYNGSEYATITVSATPLSGGPSVDVAYGLAGPDPHGGPVDFVVGWSTLSGILSPGTTYTLTANISYNGVYQDYVVPGQYSVPPSSSPTTGILFEKFLGLPLWIWLAIAAAIVVAIVALLLVSRRSAAGRLVECGECGNLIPEDATVCPKCGAEFESDLIRCSRCASTIPANSKFCPECAAQLLGKAGEGGEEAERQGYADFTEKYRAEAKRELGENYTEGSFWDWWKRQPSYVSYSQWKLQQGGTSRVGMSAPPSGTETNPAAAPGATPAAPSPPTLPPKGGAGGAAAAPAAGPMTPPPAAPPKAGAPPPAGAAAPSGGALKPCPNCGNEIPPEYLVCPFCGSVTQ